MEDPLIKRKMGLKFCSLCHLWKGEQDEFSWYTRHGKKTSSSYCRPCDSTRRRMQRKHQPIERHPVWTPAQLFNLATGQFTQIPAHAFKPYTGVSWRPETAKLVRVRFKPTTWERD